MSTPENPTVIPAEPGWRLAVIDPGDDEVVERRVIGWERDDVSGEYNPVVADRVHVGTVVLGDIRRGTRAGLFHIDELTDGRGVPADALGPIEVRR